MLVIESNIKSKNYKEVIQYIRWQDAIRQDIESIPKNNTCIFID